MSTAVGYQTAKRKIGWPSVTCILVATIFSGGPLRQAHAQLQPGDILVIDADAGTNRRGALFKVDPISLQRQVISDFGDAPPMGNNPVGVAVSNSGDILVIDRDAGTNGFGVLFSVDAVTGSRIVLHDFGAGDDRPARPTSLAIEASGDILVVDPNGGTGDPTEEGDAANSAVFRVSRAGSSRTIVVDNLGEELRGIAVRASGEILVTEAGFEEADSGRVLRINPPNPPFFVDFASPNLCAGLNNGFPTTTTEPFGIAIDASGATLITDPGFFLPNSGLVFRIDLSAPVGQQCSVLTNFGPDSEPEGVAVNASGDIFVIDRLTGLLFQIDPRTGGRTVLSNFRDGVQPQGVRPSGIAIFSGEPAPLRPLVFVPGMAASLLDEVNGGNIWPRSMLRTEVLPRLNLDPSKPVRSIFAPDVWRTEELDVPWWVDQMKEVFTPLLRMLTTQGRYLEYRVPRAPGFHSTARCDLSQRSPSLFVFPYDWRLSNANNAQALKDYIGCIRRFYPGQKVDILTHSMGGFVARRYILDNPTTHAVDRVITIATPWLGTPRAVYVLETGVFATEIHKIPCCADDVFSAYRTLLEFFPGLHQLLPSRSYFDLGGVPLAEVQRDFNRNGVASEEYSLSQYVDLLDTRFRSNPGTTSLEFHDHAGQDDWRNDRSGVQYVHIVGLQSLAKTIEKVIVTTETKCLVRICSENDAIRTQLGIGDGTVPLRSAQRIARIARIGGLAIDLNAPNARVHTVTLPDDDQVEHTELTKNPVVHNLILSALRASSETLRSVPSELKEPAVDESEPKLKPAVYFRLSGVTSADLKDNFGNTTVVLLGNRTIPREASLKSVPNVTAYVLGEDSALVVMPSDLPSDQIYTMTLRSGGEPITLELTEGTPTTMTRSIRYRDVVLPTGVTAALAIRRSNIDVLHYDSDGDGAFDTPVEPTVSVSGPAAQDDEPPIVKFRATVRPEAIHVDISAEDRGTAVKAVFFSLDGTNFLPYTDMLRLNPTRTPVVYAFAQDEVANRSGIFTFRLPRLPRDDGS